MMISDSGLLFWATLYIFLFQHNTDEVPEAESYDNRKGSRNHGRAYMAVTDTQARLLNLAICRRLLMPFPPLSFQFISGINICHLQ